jgi:hypothetical protein
MSLYKRKNMVLALALAALCAGGSLLVIARGAARASSPEPAPTGYHMPTGPELTPAGAAEAAIKAAREGTTAAGTISLRVAHGTFAQARDILDENEDVYPPSANGAASCAPGLPCSDAAVEESQRMQREEDESTAYIVEMSGPGFSPPTSRLKKGEVGSASSGEIETIIVDAHTGIAEARTIGGTPRHLESLGAVTEMSATIPSEASAPATVTRGRRARTGTIVGKVKGLSEHDIPIVLTEGDQAVSPRDVHVVRRTDTSRQNTFRLSGVLPGHYGIKASDGRCPGRKITVMAGRTTSVTLTCHR